jgi:hypothetical protein
MVALAFINIVLAVWRPRLYPRTGSASGLTP